MKKKYIIFFSICLTVLFVLVIVRVQIIKHGFTDIAGLYSDEDYEHWSAFFEEKAKQGYGYTDMTGNAIELGANELAVRLADDIDYGDSVNKYIEYSYSAYGEGQISAGDETANVGIVATGADYFEISRLDFSYGTFYRAGQLMRDLAVIDEASSWRLWGTLNTVGMNFEYNGTVMTVAGVTTGTDGRIYMPYETYTALGGDAAITNIEMLLPNPFDGYADGLFKSFTSQFGVDCETLNQTTRYKFSESLVRLTRFMSNGTRTKRISYTDAENARVVLQNKADALCLAIIIVGIATVGSAAMMVKDIVRSI